jgi:hypothetical protein
MKRTLSALVATFTLATLCTAAPAQEWVSLFDGRSMEGWTKVNAGDWTVKDGILTYTGGGNGWLRTNREYSNFSLVTTWRFPSGDRWDSGLFLRAGLDGNPWPRQGYQVQMLKGQEGGIDGSRGARARPDLLKPSGEWNTYQITVVGDTATLAINGQQATVGTGLTRPRGYIGWQAEGFPLEIRQVAIMELPASTSLNRVPLARADPGSDLQ